MIRMIYSLFLLQTAWHDLRERQIPIWIFLLFGAVGVGVVFLSLKYSGFFTRDRSSFHNSVYPRTDRFRGRILFSRICPLPFREESFAASVIRIDILQRLLPRDGYMGSLERCQCQENAAAVSAIFNSGLAVASVFLPDSRIGGY